MRYRLPSTFILLLLLGVGILAYFLGKKNASKSIENIVLNNVFVQQIAELSSLEVRGSTSVKSSNIANDGSLTDAIKKIFLEKTVNISIPYVAKYGVDLNKQKINIEEKNKQIFIVLPEPELLSYELVLDKGVANSSVGLLNASDEKSYSELMQKLYTQSREQLDRNSIYKEKTKEKIKKILTDYYAQLDLKVDITFSKDLKSKVLKDPLP
ncbi:MAG TPA: DUF4230 domain-containing protein [Niabella sp.]|nr:DUF4230 domain-containing protein [Niabella sp.]HOZ96622.1 DUF4230 domain-containing protein [Niabella sp.]HQW14510.1 DUF4230 domain-containing protein [Niabella sp.]HQX19925.1 DUF4230 domain-containing protein [Niabella sp.]HQX41198.1 DUF4230 domain-containing protein [Niabella sp.]